jgi:hypothetical protein
LWTILWKPLSAIDICLASVASDLSGAVEFADCTVEAPCASLAECTSLAVRAGVDMMAKFEKLQLNSGRKEVELVFGFYWALVPVFTVSVVTTMRPGE